MTKRNELGFTLIEISIVLVIIGVLVVGVFVGQTLIRQSQISGAVSEIQKYKSAVITFQQKYGYLPGDFPNAQTYWGAPANNTPCGNGTGVFYNDAQLAASTCNGNGDGQIDNLSNASYYNAQNGETVWLFNHLSQAGMIDGRYYAGKKSVSGVLIPFVPGYNVPASKISNGVYTLAYFGTNWGGGTYTSWTNLNYGHAMVLGMMSTNLALDSYPAYPWYPLLTVAEAQALDTKIDDGAPATGNLMTFPNGSYYGGLCATTAYNHPSTAAYNISASGIQCPLIFLMQDF